MIISQTKVFNIFPGATRISSFSKILKPNCKRYTYEYIPVRELLAEISNSNKKSCLTIDCRNFNFLGPSKFKTSADSGTEQICYYNRKDKSFIRFLAIRKETADDSVIFEIKNILEQTKTSGFDYYDINSKLEEINDGRSDDNRTNFKRSVSESGATTIEEENLSEKSQDFFQDDNVVIKKN